MTVAITQALDHTDAIAQAWWEQARAHGLAGQTDHALACAQEAARVRATQNRWLMWPEWESLVGQIGQSMELPRHTPAPTGGQMSTCHVLNEALPAGGVTTMATRWIDMDPEAAAPQVILLDDSSAIPVRLHRAVHARGGRVWRPDPGLSLSQRVRWLRQLLDTQARRVVLHSDPADVLCAAALSRPGGAPVMWVNHTAHSFATGISVADTVVNVRGSALEWQWSRHLRGAEHITTVPIPVSSSPSAADAQQDRLATRQAWDLPPQAAVVLSIGSRFKFDPLEEPDFLNTWQTILGQAPHAVLCMVGFPPDGRWRSAQARWGHRLRVMGPLQAQPLARLMRAADVYAEGFALGTTTALLESVQAGAPALLAPAPYGPPYGSDGIAIDEAWPRPASVDAYVNQALLWLNDPQTRQQHAVRMQRQVQEHHTGTGWQSHLTAAYADLPSHHSPCPLRPIQPTPWVIHERWTRFRSVWATPVAQLLSESLMRGWQQGVSLAPPALGGLVAQRRLSVIGPRYVEELAMRGLNRLPPAQRPALGCFLLRASRWISGRRRHRLPGAYDEYRQMSDCTAQAQ